MVTVAALYHFTRFEDPKAIQAPLRALCDAEGIRGSLLIAREGINGTVAGRRAGLDRVLAHIRSLPGCAGLAHRESRASGVPFNRMKVRLKKEIVTMGRPDVDPTVAVGRHVDPGDWNDLIRRDDVVVIDTRNDYEVALGTFAGAIDPKTGCFGEFPDWWRKNGGRFRNKRIAMFCTGGIRCEKSTSFLIGQGVQDVCHLKGGILKYLQEAPAGDSTWQGHCFVFDRRVSMGHGLLEGPHRLCFACRRPILPEDRARAGYEEGVNCHQCVGETSGDRKSRFRERQGQIALARARGESHAGLRGCLRAGYFGQDEQDERAGA